MTERNEVVVHYCFHACPFFSVVDMEKIMLCNHPHWLSKPAYSGAIITHENSKDRVPDECPLRKGPVTTVRTVRFERK